MKKARNGFIKNVHYICLIGVIALGLITIVGSNGGGGSGGGDGEDDPTPTPTSYNISGQVTSNGTGLSGVTITLSGDGSDTKTTDRDGNYSFSGLSDGLYTVTPSMTGYTCDPSSRDINISGADVTGINFDAEPSSQEPQLFPMYQDAAWKYSIRKVVTNAWGYDVDEDTQTGTITIAVIDFNADEKMATLSVIGDRDIHTSIPETFYLREDSGRLEIANSPTGSWEPTLDTTGNSWEGDFMLVPNVRNPDTYTELSMNADSSTIETNVGTFDATCVESEYDNSTSQYVTEVYTIRSKQHFADAGLVYSSYYWYNRIKNYQYGWGYGSTEVTIELKGYSIPQPDGTVLEEGEIPETPSSSPTAPSGLQANTISNSQIDLLWQDNSNFEEGFKIERKIGEDGTYDEIATVGTNTTSYSDTGLSENTTYYYRVRAYNGNGDSEYSNEASSTTHGPPVAPSDLDAQFKTHPSQDYILLTWTDNSNNETGFEVEYKEGAGAWEVLGGDPTGEDQTSISVVGISTGRTYYFRVRALNSYGYSDYSNETSVAVP